MRFKFFFHSSPVSACCDDTGNIEVYLKNIHTKSELVDTIYHESVHAVLYELESKLTNIQHHKIIKALENW